MNQSIKEAFARFKQHVVSQFATKDELNSAAVRYDVKQSLTNTQKVLARSNINAAPAGYGWGESSVQTPAGNELNNANNTGLYLVNENTINSPSLDCVIVFSKAIDEYTTLQTAYSADGHRIAVRASKLETIVGPSNGEWTPDIFDTRVWGEWEYIDESINKALTSAEVGQVLVVKAVDENGKPTEWEAKNTTDVNSSNSIVMQDKETEKLYNVYVSNGQLLVEEKIEE